MPEDEGEVPLDFVDLPTPPGVFADQVVVCVYRPGHGWISRAYPASMAHLILPLPRGGRLI